MSENYYDPNPYQAYPSFYFPTASPAYYPAYDPRQFPQYEQQYEQQIPQYEQQQFPQYQQQMPQYQQQQFPQYQQIPQYQQMQPQQPPTQQPMLPSEQSYIENILRLNEGKTATVYMTFENNEQWNAKIFKGIVEAAGRDHIILSDPKTGKRYLLLMIYLDYITFDEELNYQYPFNGGQITQQPTREDT
ncbi:spore coat protein GerQ [Lentibacillus cibarius]|uniref:Spore coat protein GerQ n=1 Tax=Lentibacillus cibarius TaxID=2583219 RepID=A0A549YG00_9BACI|nr:spore coat protein GerQ [Lentibacillus cibarius]TRM10819.1 spore coat protein GerQ [Lentibacillus cibarius]